VNSGDGSVDAAHDVNAVPQYNTGVFGNRYLEARPGSPYRSGSRSSGDAGLYHYTTRIDQLKEAGGHSVNIGSHYIAANAAGAPIDTDDDDLPDYVENASGDGSTRSYGAETDWEQQTTTGVEDKRNPIYHATDLDGDGMVGAIETLWSKNPSVPDNPLWADGPSGSIQGIVEVPVSLTAAQSADELGVQLLVAPDLSSTEEPTCFEEASGAELVTAGAGSPKFVWNTCYDHVGTSIALVQRQGPPGLGVVQGKIRRIANTNPFQASPMVRFFGDHFVFEAQSKYPDGRYTLGFFDENDQPLKYTEAGQQKEFSITGSIDETGYVDVSWDLHFPNGSAYAGDVVRVTCNVTAGPEDPARLQPSATAPAFGSSREQVWASYDKFVTFFGRGNYTPEDDLRAREIMFDDVHEALMAAGEQGSPYVLNPESTWVEIIEPTPSSSRCAHGCLTGRSNSRC
jgi:hypothetical protein